MSNFDKCMTICIILIGCVLSSLVTQDIIASDIKALNDSYHCAPIVKVKTLEEAKSIIEAHQKRMGSK